MSNAMHDLLRRVRRSLLVGVLGAAVLNAAADCRSGTSGGVVVLTNSVPVLRIAIPAKVVEEKRTSLELRILDIKNPKDTTFSIAVFLESRGVGETSDGPRVPSTEVGVLGVYPAGQTGDYRLEASPALDRLAHAAAGGRRLCLRLELLPVHATEKLRGVEVKLSEPQWLRVD